MFKLEYTKKLFNLLSCLELCGIDSDTTIAGGALRDMLLDKEIADVDVFYRGSFNDDSAFFKHTFKCKHNTQSYPDGWQVTHTLEWPQLPVPIQLIRVKDVAAHIAAFPAPMCRATLNLEKGLVVSHDLIDTAYHEELYIDQPINKTYLAKLKQKFPNYKVLFLNDSHNPDTNVELPF